MEYRANQALPPYTVSRLAVLHSDELSQSCSWRFGALLQLENTTALVEEDERTCTVTVSVIGPKQTEYISKIRTTLDRIFGDYRSKKPELQVEVLLPNELNDSHTMLALRQENKSLMLAENTIQDFMAAGQPYPISDMVSLQKISLDKTAQAYNLYIGQVIFAGHIGSVEAKDDHSGHNVFNFNDCSINLQGSLNDFASTLRNKFEEGDEDAADIDEAVAKLDEAQKLINENPDEEAVKQEIKMKGLLNRIKGICDDMLDENSELHKKTIKITRGLKTAQKIAKQYNDIAQWVGLPQVPKPLLGEQGKD